MAGLSLLVSSSVAAYGYDPEQRVASTREVSSVPGAEPDVASASLAARTYDDPDNAERTSTRPAGSRLAPRAASALEDASQAAFRAADNIDDFAVPLKHQPWASGSYARFTEGVDQQRLIARALRSDGAMFLPNNRPGSFRVVYDFGQTIGTRGETALPIVVGQRRSHLDSLPGQAMIELRFSHLRSERPTLHHPADVLVGVTADLELLTDAGLIYEEPDFPWSSWQQS
ncbi:MAG TPA: hypothetical protein VE569_03220 [Acidimicrobiia bacterium]|jgi:hypothetical protein|nr:hypothetical protein [Acidimicrobiia bacterium]